MYSTFLEITDKYNFLLVKRNNFQPMFKGSLTYELAYQEIEILEIIDSFLIHYSFLSNHFAQILCRCPPFNQDNFGTDRLVEKAVKQLTVLNLITCSMLGW